MSKKIIGLISIGILITTGLSGTQLKYKRSIVTEEVVGLSGFILKNNYIYSFGDSKIYQFDLDGKKILSFGQKGKGPGDFELLYGLVVTDQHILAADYSGKTVAIFDLKGKLVKEHPTKYYVLSTLTAGETTFYLGGFLKRGEKGKKWKTQLILVDLNTEKEILTLPDQSQVHAVHPSRGMLPFPWFPNPFYDRPLFFTGEDGRLRIFFCRRAYFLVSDEAGFKKVPIEYKFQPQKVNEKDRTAFFNQLKLINRRQFPARTRNSVTFPKTMENFHGAMNWGDKIALIQLDKIILISREGKFLRTIPIPQKIRKKSRFDGYIFPEKFMQFYQNKLYYGDQDEDKLMVFDLVK